MYFAIDLFVLGVRALSILALFQAAGGYVFLRAFERELEESAAPIRSLVRWSALTAVVAAMVYFFLVPVRMAGSFDGLFDTVLATLASSSSIESAQVAAFAGLALIAVSIDVDDGFNRNLCLIGAALAVLSFALTGHTTIHDMRLALAPALVVHVGVAAAWFGALWPLRVVAGAESADARTAIIERFSFYALRAVPALFAFGLIMSVIFLGSIDQLATAYAAMLGLKVVGFVAVLAIANFNRGRLSPAMAAGDESAVERFRRVLIVEAAAIGAVVLATVLMTGFFAPENLHGSFSEDHATEPH